MNEEPSALSFATKLTGMREGNTDAAGKFGERVFPAT